MLLHSKATTIQRWFRRLRSRAVSSTDVDVQYSPVFDVVQDKEEQDAVMRRRRLKAELARQEILKELERESAKVAGSGNNIPADIAPAAEPTPSPALPTPARDGADPVDVADQADDADSVHYEEDFEEFESDAAECWEPEDTDLVPAAGPQEISDEVECTNDQDLPSHGAAAPAADVGLVDAVVVRQPDPPPLVEIQPKEPYREAEPPVSSPSQRHQSIVPDPKPVHTKRSSAADGSKPTAVAISAEARSGERILSTLPTAPSQEPDAASQSVSRILSYLKSVEQAPVQIQSPLAHQPSVFDDVKQKILATQLELNQKTKTITALQSELNRQRDASKKDLEEHQKTSRSQLALQRKEYETIVKRHLSFIDNILAEKESLSAKTLELTEKVTTLERQFHHKSVAMEEAHLRNLNQQKEIWQAAEKVKRDKWIQERTKIIKEQTVQGLEPEIQKLIATQKSQLRQAEENYREGLNREKNSLMESFQSQLNQLREKHVAERQKACEEEREFARQRYVKQLEREEMEVGRSW
ncbi:Centrosomal protein of 131 kDa [Kappamyces sp. JEL0680]|nr:Centrosomal protein of 131 kDa [Kappamyces sp. JEL0680]